MTINEANSYRTAIARKNLSLPMCHLIDEWGMKFPSNPKYSLDYGCGRGYDADFNGTYKYDPHYFPKKPKGPFQYITCIYVLNVVSVATGQKIVEDIQRLLARDGIAYVAWRADIKKPTKSQRTVNLYIMNDRGRLVRYGSDFNIVQIFKDDEVKVS